MDREATILRKVECEYYQEEWWNNTVGRLYAKKHGMVYGTK